MYASPRACFLYCAPVVRDRIFGYMIHMFECDFFARVSLPEYELFDASSFEDMKYDAIDVLLLC